MFIEQSIASVREAVMLGSVLVIVIIFVFLRSWRSTLIICTSIPISIIGTFALLFFGGYTLNTMTFGGLALGVGMIVDASIVVLENTQRHLEMGKSRKQASIEGSEEIWSAILASTLTHVAVFVPLFFLTGFSSVLFKQLSVVVVFSLLMSLFVAVTLVPVLCSLLMTEHDEDQERTGIIGWMFRSSGRFLDGMDARYARVLGMALHHRPTVLAVGASLFALAIFLSPYLKFELMPQTDEGEVRVDIELPVGTRVEQTQAAIIDIEDKIRKGVPEAVMLISQGGGGGGFMGGASTHRGEFTIQLKPKAERTRSNEAIAQDLRRTAHRHPWRDRAVPRVRRLAAQPHPRRQPGRAPVTRDSWLRLRRRAAPGERVGGPVAHRPRHRRRAPGAPGRPPGTRGPRRS